MTAYLDDPAVVDTVSIRIAGATIHVQGVASEHTVDLVLGGIDYVTRTAPAVTLDLTLVTAIDAVAARALLMARFDALADGATLELVVPGHLQRRLTVCRPLTVTPGHYRNPPPPPQRRSAGIDRKRQ